jgi:hypothetical protein
MGSVTIQDADIGALASGDYPLIPLTIPIRFQAERFSLLKNRRRPPCDRASRTP